MLTPEQFEVISKQASKLYTNLELQIIEEIATRIANAGYANTVALNNILLAQEMGYMYEEVVNLVAKYNNQTEEEIRNIFYEAGAHTLKFDDRIYKEAGLNPVPIQKSKSIVQLMEATVIKTNNNLNNLVMTTANTTQTQFYNAMNKAYMEVSTGLKSYSQAITDTIKDISSQGALIEYPSGRKLNVESAVRMNIVTGVNQTCGKLQMLRAKELEWDLMELTAHAGARPTHAEWQGRIVSLSRQDGYLSLDDIGYGTVTGFKGVNCNHDWMPFYEGSTKTYTNKELEKMANETVTYNGQDISRYDAMQMQRRMERQIRQDKRDMAGLQGILTSTTKDDKLIEKTKESLVNVQIKAKQHNTELNDFLNQTKFKKDNTRLQIGKMGATKDVKDGIIFKNNKRKEKMNYQDITTNWKENATPNSHKIKLNNKDFIDSKTNIIYTVDNKYVIFKPSKNEQNVASWLKNTLGGEIEINPRISDPPSVKISDYYFRGMRFDLKEINGNGRNTIDTAIKSKREQADNFILDIQVKCKIKDNEIIKQIEKIYNAKNREWVNVIIVKRKDELIGIYKRKRN